MESHESETAFLARAFEADGVLSPEQIAFLRQRGFLHTPRHSEPEDYEEDRRRAARFELEDRDNELDDLGVRSIRRSPAGRGRTRHLQDWSAHDLASHLGTQLEAVGSRLLPLAHLAPEADTWSETLVVLRGLDCDERRRRMAIALDSGFLTFAELWDVLALETFREPIAEASGPAYRAFRAALQAADHEQIPGKYASILAHEEIALIYQLTCVQRLLHQTAGRIWIESPRLIARCLRQSPHRVGLLVHVLLFNCQPRGSAAREWSPRDEEFGCLPPEDHRDEYRLAWRLAAPLDAGAVVSFLVDSVVEPCLRCPLGWNEIGYRVRGTNP